MGNILLEPVEYRIDRTDFGVWRRYLYSTGACFAEFKSHRVHFGLPLVHFTRGICPETGKRVTAKGIVAVGRRAAGVVAVGQASFGFFAFGQLALGLIFGLGQATSGIVAIGQIAAGLHMAVGQFACGEYVLAQLGIGDHVWSMKRADPEAMEFFRDLAAGWWR